MNSEQALAVFENYKIRRVYAEASETWYFSVVDIVAALIQQPNYQAARNYWKVLKNRLSKEGSESVTKCNRLKLPAADRRGQETREGVREMVPTKDAKSAALRRLQKETDADLTAFTPAVLADNRPRRDAESRGESRIRGRTAPSSSIAEGMADRDEGHPIARG